MQPLDPAQLNIVCKELYQPSLADVVTSNYKIYDIIMIRNYKQTKDSDSSCANDRFSNKFVPVLCNGGS